ncbi:MAG: helix-turn-helix domain-containing protein [Solirubrobacteraceae bacterium]|nr:helix-turn-helix domain-containing protein [Solirubrobacteraceae bacterium]
MDVATGELVGREAEVALVNDLLVRARRGEGGVLTLRGEPGAGKTSLLGRAKQLADDFTIVSCCGVEWEAEIPFSGLHELLRPLDSLHDALPAPQRRELDAAMGRDDSVPVQGFHLHVATLSLILEATRERPTLVIADDLQWIDTVSTQALGFVGRRIAGEAVAVLVATRPGARLPGLPEPVDLAPLDRAAVGELAARHLGGRALPETALDELTRASGGNPLAVAESAAHAGDRLWLRGAGLDTPLPVGTLIERGFSSRLDGLSAEALTAAGVVAESIADDEATVRRAIAERGLSPAALTEAVDQRVLVHEDGRWRFSHPLLRSILHSRASGAERRAAHAALAAAATTTGLAAWHAAEASAEPNREVADTLADAAAQYMAMSGVSAAAQAFERSAELTPDQELAALRFVDAARAARFAGTPAERVRGLVARAAALATSEAALARAEFELLLLREDVDDSRQHHEKMDRLFTRVLGLDDGMAGELARAMSNDAVLLGDLELVRRSLDRLRTVRHRSVSPEIRFGIVAELAATAVLQGEPGVHDADVLEAAAEQRELVDVDGMSPGVSAGIAALVEGLMWIEELERAEHAADECVRLARAQGDAFAEMVGRLGECEIAFRLGAWSRSLVAAERGIVLGDVLGSESTSAVCAAIRESIVGLRTGVGDATVLARAEQTGRDAGVAILSEYASVARGLAALSAGDAAAAARHFEVVRAWKRAAGQVEPSIGTWPVDLVLAHVLAGDADAARNALADVRDHAEARGRRWALAAVPWLEAMLDSDDGRAFASFELALERYPAARAPFEEARARLAYGQRLRRANRRADARAHLESALATFEALGAEPWAERARRELGASGQGVRRAAAHQRDELTLQERQVAALVAAGASNKEAAGELFLSPKTIETHLSRVYRKLGVSSRTQLAARWDELSQS